MAEAVNFFQSLKIFGLFSNPRIDTSERKLSRELIKDAKNSFERAETEARNGDEAKILLLATDDRELKKNLAKIAVWHYETAAKHFRYTAARYSEASRIRPDQEKLLTRHSEKINRLAQVIEKTVESLNSFE